MKYTITGFSEYAQLAPKVLAFIQSYVTPLKFPFTATATGEMSTDFPVPIVRLPNGKEMSLCYFVYSEL